MTNSLARKSTYGKFLPRTMQEAYVQNIDDPNLMDLRAEISLLRALLGKVVENLDPEAAIDSGQTAAITKLVDTINKTHAAISAHEDKMKEVIPIRMIPALFKSIADIIRQVISNEDQVRAIAEKINKIPILREAKIIDAE